MKDTKTKESDWDTVQRVVQTHQIHQLILIGGEPLLVWNRWKERVHWLHSRVDEVIITTNGSLLTKKIVQEILDWSNVYLQITLYTDQDATRIRHIFDVFTQYRHRWHIHFTLCPENIAFYRRQVTRFHNDSIWVSFERNLHTSMVQDVLQLLEEGLLRIEYLRDTKTAGKNCITLYGKNYVINGTIVANDCLHRQSVGTTRTYHSECLSCTNQFCDACICSDIVPDKTYICEVFRTIEKWSEVCEPYRY